jgi:hypothetical protein
MFVLTDRGVNFRRSFSAMSVARNRSERVSDSIVLGELIPGVGGDESDEGPWPTERAVDPDSSAGVRHLCTQGENPLVSHLYAGADRRASRRPSEVALTVRCRKPAPVLSRLSS